MNIIFTDESDPRLLEINNRTRKWTGKFVTIKPEVAALLPTDNARLNGQAMRVREVGWTYDEVDVWWSNPETPWLPWHAWMWCDDLDLVDEVKS